MTLFAFRTYNTETLYAYGTEAEAELYRSRLNRGREINCYQIEALPEAEEAAFADRDDVVDLQDWLVEESPQLVSSDQFAEHGYQAEAELLIELDRYVVTLTTQAGEEREVAWEPAEPDRQAQAVRFAMRDPVGAVLDAIQIDKDRRAEHVSEEE